jgi:hypothetical protein
MKRAIYWTVVILTFAAGVYVVLGAQGQEGMMGGMMGQHKGMMEPNSMMMEKCMTMMREKGMGHMGMHPMMHSSMVATSHGGVIVMIGPKLLKYDKDLNLVKETEIKIDWKAWHKSMMEHHNMMMQEQKPK